MGTKTTQPISSAIPDELREALDLVNEMIDEGEDSTKQESDDLIQVDSLCGGLMDGARQLFAFTYYPPEYDTRGERWFLELTGSQIHQLGDGYLATLPLWVCPTCHCRFSRRDDLCGERCLGASTDEPQTVSDAEVEPGVLVSFGQGRSTHITSVMELDALLDTLGEQAPRTIVKLRHGSNARLFVGFDGQDAMLCHLNPNDAYRTSFSNELYTETKTFTASGRTQEIELSSCIEPELARRAAREFFATGEASSEVTWQRSCFGFALGIDW